MTDEHKIAEQVAAHEAKNGAERIAFEDLADYNPAYAAVLVAAASTDMDREALQARVARIVQETRDLAEEAIRVRDQHEVQIEALKAERLRERHDASLANAMGLPAPPAPPPTLVHWIRRQIALHPVAGDHHPVLTLPDVRLGDLRAWLSAFDADIGVDGGNRER